MLLLGAHWLRCQWPQVTDRDTEASLARTQLWGRECPCNTQCTAVTTTHWEFGGVPSASPRGCDTCGSRRLLPAPMLLHRRLTPPPVTAPAMLGLAHLQGLTSPWPTRSCKQGLRRDCPCPKGQATAVCRNQSIPMILAKKYTRGSESLVWRSRMRGQREC